MIVNPVIYGRSGEHFSTMPFTAELAALFEPDSIDTENDLWRNKIIGGSDMELIGGAASDNALHFASDEYGHVEADFFYSAYLVVKKPVLDVNKCLFGSSPSRVSYPVIQCWNNGNSQGSFFECVTGDSNYNLYMTTDQLLKYHVVSVTVSDNPNLIADNSEWSAAAYWLVDNALLGVTPFKRDMTNQDSFKDFNGVVAINTQAKGDVGSIDYTPFVCKQDSYYRAFAFGGKQTLEQMRANHKYLYERYCV